MGTKQTLLLAISLLLFGVATMCREHAIEKRLDRLETK